MSRRGFDNFAAIDRSFWRGLVVFDRAVRGTVRGIMDDLFGLDFPAKSYAPLFGDRYRLAFGVYTVAAGQLPKGTVLAFLEDRGNGDWLMARRSGGILIVPKLILHRVDDGH